VPPVRRFIPRFAATFARGPALAHHQIAGDTRRRGQTAEVQYQNIEGADLSEFKDAPTQAVVWPSSLASGTLIYPYAKAKRDIK
jgi:hypothetical protein